ncbi:iron-containing alcohol dehydrogenase [Rhodococcus sp. BP-149]|uniref:iron-containing alcohol dehydrogenase n=1 Tax=unclassified Rhodococcus (in: high G+C Gram-positive bacteria) TaxID=192944 RepID=UPI001C9A7E41|nr:MULTISPECIES: iron-containing alcohol dehydrogenase [unclassified Rhodococcus (in: high G+C Gram-positive bacteria)]MBY6676082.1 iron-containing alcohol dehydrogenase [Rhodococcus sp. BP-332]MBY6686450.1 iron-containing alcohol dehydrogenase [Rhodococcus sp. BP-288]MBY6693461.1 iron-containing alcohol dehydrogenase [Rhodococcus sp. BP-188]MBY6699942.1 iron-containing alcohol dehydrogenase [Rhodococcus sp. BP-285]MBY6703713.1 iron-containing alcohol dehydrogenase [Rhodococcus sp. BP-283]
MSTSISFPRFLRMGPGAVEDLGQVLDDLGVERPLLVTDKFMVSTGAADRVMGIIAAAGKTGALFAETVPDPTTDSLTAGVAAVAAHDADAVIGFGGGSPMDTAKALSVLSKGGGVMRDYKAPGPYTGPALPIIAIPTTAGSGSEATQFTVITDSESDEKMLCPGLSFLPIASVVDPELTMSMPPRLTADTGVDALTHAIEAYVSKKANPISDALALNAMRTIGRFLVRAYTDGDDAEARAAMMAASTQAGMAFSNASVCLVHGMSRPIGGHFHVAHGLSNAMLLPAVTAFSIPGAPERYAECARQLGAAHEGDGDDVASAALVTYIENLCATVEVPSPSAHGLDADKWEKLVPLMAEQALASGSPNNNPVVPTAQQIEELYRQVF